MLYGRSRWDGVTGDKAERSGVELPEAAPAGSPPDLDEEAAGGEPGGREAMGGISRRRKWGTRTPSWALESPFGTRGFTTGRRNAFESLRIARDRRMRTVRTNQGRGPCPRRGG